MNILHPKIINVLLVTALLGTVVLTGCATSAPQARFTQEIAPAARIRANDEAKITIEAADGVSIVDYEKQRFTQRLQEKIASRKALNAATREKRDFEIDVTLTQYEKGSAFARAMLAGLGQIHIAGNVKVYILPDREKVGEFTIRKTFAWGGIYGASTTIEDAEMGFADGVAAALAYQTDGASPKTQHSGKSSG